MRALTTSLLVLPFAALAASCEILAGIQDISYVAGDASAGSSSGDNVNPQTSGDNTSAMSGNPVGGSGGTTPASGSPVASSGGPVASSGSSGAVSASGAVATSGAPVVSSGSTASGAPQGSTDAGSCKASPATGTLPFAVDSFYAATGVIGDTGAATTNTTGCAMRAPPATPVGLCHAVKYTPAAPATTTLDWAGIYWQYNRDWGAQAGYAIPAGATTVTFWAKGQLGGEQVSFIVGYTGAPTAATPCADSIRGNTNIVALSTTWTQYTISLAGQTYADGVLGAFGWVANAPDSGATPVTFYVDDIEYQ